MSFFWVYGVPLGSWRSVGFMVFLEVRVCHWGLWYAYIHSDVGRRLFAMKVERRASNQGQGRSCCSKISCLPPPPPFCWIGGSWQGAYGDTQKIEMNWATEGIRSYRDNGDGLRNGENAFVITQAREISSHHRTKIYTHYFSQPLLPSILVESVKIPPICVVPYGWVAHLVKSSSLYTPLARTALWHYFSDGAIRAEAALWWRYALCLLYPSIHPAMVTRVIHLAGVVHQEDYFHILWVYNQASQLIHHVG